MSLRDRFIQELEKNEEGLEDSQMKVIFGQEYIDLVSIIQDLLNDNRLRILQGPDGYVYVLQTNEEVKKQSQFDDLGDAEMLVYQCIERSENQGIWLREIKARTGLHSSAINRIIKKLEQRKLIKSFKSILSKTKKLYILYDMELPKDVTGGPWYVEQEFDTEFVDIISQFVEKILMKENMLKVEEILEQIKQSNLSKVPLSEKDILQLLEKMSFCNTVEEVVGPKGEMMWKLKQNVSTFDSISATPCGKCPMFYRCFCNATVNPNKCPYINQWYNLGEYYVCLHNHNIAGGVD